MAGQNNLIRPKSVKEISRNRINCLFAFKLVTLLYTLQRCPKFEEKLLSAISSTFSLAMAGRWPAKDAACAKGRRVGTGGRREMTGIAFHPWSFTGIAFQAVKPDKLNQRVNCSV